MGEHAIALNSVKLVRDHFTFGPLDLEIPKGYVTAIVGPNGSGKSTLFRMIMNTIKPQQGNVHVLGEQLDYDNDDELKQNIGYLQEEATTFDYFLKGSDKAAFHAKWFRGWNKDTYQRLISNLTTRDDLQLKKMSKGMRRKFDLSLAMAHHPKLLLLDEPSSGLDPLAWKMMIEVLHQYMENEDHTVLMATHIVDEVKRLADYIVFLVDGQVLGMYEKDELLQSWSMYFVEASAGSGFDVRQMPGYCEHKEVSTGFYEVICSKSLEAERWLETQVVTMRSKQILELDEILLQHMKKARLYAK